MNAWPTVALGEVIDHRKEFVIINDLETYRRPRVQLHAQGIVLRDAVPGAQIKTKKQQTARAGEFLVAEIDAKVGGFGIVPDDLDGSIVSSHYFLYSHKPDRLDNKYLGWFVKTHAFRRQVEAQGSTNYAAIRPGDVLRYEIPLPPLDEQCRIVNRLNILAEKSRQVEKHLEAVERDAKHLLALQFRDAIANAPLHPMAEVAPLVRRKISIDPNASYTELGVRSFYKGTFKRRTVTGAEFSWQDLYGINTGDLVFSNIMAWEQAIAIAKVEDHGCVGNHRMLTCEAKTDCAVPGFLWYYFTTPDGFDKVYAASPGTSARNRTMTAPSLMAIEVPLPPLTVQQTFDRLHAEVVALKHKHAAIRTANKALLPAILEQVFS